MPPFRVLGPGRAGRLLAVALSAVGWESVGLVGREDEPAAAASRRRWPGRTVHVECETLDQVRESLEAGADALLFDNMTPAGIAACVAEVRGHASRHGVRPLLEASGGITLAAEADYAATGVDCISSGALTNSAPALDLGLDLYDPESTCS